MQLSVDDAGGAPALSVVIKAYNEEAKIGACLRSVMQALQACPLSAEVVVADSVSADRTVAIAQEFPVRVVQFRHAHERGCGAGVQLGYQCARGRYVLLLDGDMQLQPGFLPAALQALHDDPRLAGVAGLLVDTEVRNAFDRHRVNDAVSSVARMEQWLNGGGLYRRQAIEQSGGYAADRNLKGWEEADLGMRLRAHGFALRRISVEAVRHEGHASGTAALLRRLWRGGRAAAGGVLLRQAWGRAWFVDAVRLLAEPLATLAWWGLGLLAAALALGMADARPVLLWLLATAAALLAQCWRKRSVRAGLTSIGLWHFWAAGLLTGLVKPRVPPQQPIDCIDLSPGRPAQVG